MTDGSSVISSWRRPQGVSCVTVARIAMLSYMNWARGGYLISEDGSLGARCLTCWTYLLLKTKCMCCSINMIWRRRSATLIRL